MKKTPIVLAAVVVAGVASVLVVRDLQKTRAVDACILHLEAAPSPDPVVGIQSFVAACGPMYRESGCRDAMEKAARSETDPSQRARITAEGCRDAYCPKLSSPKPELCSQSEVNLLTTATTWRPFVQAVLVHDLGEKRATRVLTAMDAHRAAAKKP